MVARADKIRKFSTNSWKKVIVKMCDLKAKFCEGFFVFGFFFVSVCLFDFLIVK